MCVAPLWALLFVFDDMLIVNVFVCPRPLSPSSVAYVYRLSGETRCWHCPVSTPSAKHAGSSTALYWSKMAWELVSTNVFVCKI